MIIVAVACGCSASTSTPTGAVDGGATSNVQFAEPTCPSPGACGGDPRGTWTIVSGCTQPSSAGWCSTAVASGNGTVSGTYRISDGGYTFEQEREVVACGRRAGHSGSISAPCTISGSRLVFESGGGVDFCVQGDTLYIIDVSATYPDLAVVKLARAVEPNDAAP